MSKYSLLLCLIFLPVLKEMKTFPWAPEASCRLGAEPALLNGEVGSVLEMPGNSSVRGAHTGSHPSLCLPEANLSALGLWNILPLQPRGAAAVASPASAEKQGGTRDLQPWV